MSVKNVLRKMYHENAPIFQAALFCIRIAPFNNEFRVKKNNKLSIKSAYLKKCRFEVAGTGNTVSIGNGCRLKNCRFYIAGNNNIITLNENISATDAEFWIEDCGNNICLGERTTIAGKTHLACIEGTTIKIGNDNMLSANIVFRTGDSHSIIDMDGKRINQSLNINIGSHVWIGNSVIIMKGVSICDDSIIGTGSVVTKAFDESHIAVAGNPARIVKSGVTWDRRRIPIGE